MKDDITLRKAAAIKTARSIIRLKHSLAADEELNRVLPQVELAFDRAVNGGELPDVAELIAAQVLLTE
jgi:hypothetical protein